MEPMKFIKAEDGAFLRTGQRGDIIITTALIPADPHLS